MNQRNRIEGQRMGIQGKFHQPAESGLIRIVTGQIGSGIGIAELGGFSSVQDAIAVSVGRGRVGKHLLVTDALEPAAT